MANKRKAEPWFDKAADQMVRTGKSLPQIVSEMSLEITSAEALRISKTQDFEKALWVARNRYQDELAQMPGRSKMQAKGMAVFCIQKLIEAGKWEKAIASLVTLAKLEGWMEPESTVNVFAGLSQKDFDALKQKVKAVETVSPPQTDSLFSN